MDTNADPILSPSESCPIRQRIGADSLAELDRMADDGFMRPVIDYGDAWEVETTRGDTFIVPADVQYIPDRMTGPDGKEHTTDAGRVFECIDAPGVDEDSEDAGPFLSRAAANALGQYMPEGCSGGVRSATIRRGVYLARMSAPGYTDCTDWEAHDTAQGAADSLIENYGD